jgi:ABC-type Zn uptake system ZnuABC Zn-binding protein ZnuA
MNSLSLEPARRTALVAAAVVLGAAAALGVSACGSGGPSGSTGSSLALEKPSVIAETTYLADIVSNVAGDLVEVESLLPLGADPHAFDPTPRDAATVAKAAALVINSPGFEPPVDSLIKGAGGRDLQVIDASKGLGGDNPDPHFWLDPLDVITYVENIRAGLTAIHPEGAEEFAANADAYQRRLRELDSWIKSQVAQVPPSERLLVTNHESFAHFADRYGFTVVGTVFPGTDTEGAPSAEALGTLIQDIRATGARAIFLETGSNPDLADQVARETGVKVVRDLYTHSLAENAPSYLDMMRWNVDRIVEALR